MKDFMGMMKQAQELQGKMGEIQNALDDVTVEGVSGGGLVRMTINGKGEMKTLSIDPSLMVEQEVEILEDLIVAAYGDGRSKSEKIMQEKMAEFTGGMQLPLDMKLF